MESCDKDTPMSKLVNDSKKCTKNEREKERGVSNLS